MNVIVITLTGLVLLFFIGFITFSFLNYKKRFNVKFNPLNMFPYELNFEASIKDNFLGNLMMFFTSLTSITLFVFIIKSSTGGFILILSISGIISSVLFSLIPLIHLKFLKTHLLVDVLFFVATLLSLVSNALIALNYYQVWLNSENNPSLMLCIIDFVFSGLYLIVLLNPKISLWAKLEQVNNADGTSYYQRPKFFSLAYTEWISYIFFIISIVLTLINYVAKLM